MKLGKLTRVDLRDYWKHEAPDFTCWFAKPENIEITAFSKVLQPLTLKAME
jgi:hypothetical protein